MGRIRRNIAANIVGKVWSVLSVYLFVPIYLRLLGPEAYGIVGFHAALQGVLAIADLGLSATLNRQLARMSAGGDSAARMRNLVRTIELVYAGLTVLLVILVEATAGIIARHWLKTETMPVATVESAIRLMGVALAVQFPASLYLGGLLGLQRQVPANTIQIVMGTFRGAGAALVLWLVSPSVGAYLWWQILSSLGLVCVLRAYLWRSLPRAPGRASFDSSAVAAIWRYAAGVAVISLISVTLMQIDKLTISKLLPLTALAWYSLAATLGQVPTLISASVGNAVFPRLAQRLVRGEEKALAEDYHRFSQAVAILVIPAGLTLAAFSREVILLWTHSPESARAAHTAASLLLVGSVALAVQVVPFSLALAAEWTRLTINIGAAMLLVMVPTMIGLVQRFGLTGAGITWVLLNCCTVVLTVVFLHRRLLRGEAARWFGRDVGRPLLPALGCVIAGRLLTPADAGTWRVLITIALTGGLALLLAAVVTLREPWLELRRLFPSTSGDRAS